MSKHYSTLFWHDYETTGVDPRRDRPLEFAGLRTTFDLEVVGEPVVLWCQPARDTLPHPEALLLIGATPQEVEARGLRECEFADRVHDELAFPGTCGVGYNSLRFDDEVTRHLLWRNLHDPYGREWRNGNSRWDLIDLVRLASTLRPEGLEWPERAPGVLSLRLEDLSAVNGLDHAQAHEALADVEATLALARKLRRAQPRLWDFHFALRHRSRVAALLDWVRVEPVFHASSRYPAARHRGSAIVAPILPVPNRRNEIVVFDLEADPNILVSLEPDAIAERLFTPRADLPEESERIPLKTIHTNRAPAVAPLTALRREDARRLGFDLDRCLDTLTRFRTQIHEIRNKLAIVYSPTPRIDEDPEIALYQRLIGDRDLDHLPLARSALLSAGAANFDWTSFEDLRLRELAWRYRARNAPAALTANERARWARLVHERIAGESQATTLKLVELRRRVAEIRSNPATDLQGHRVLDALLVWAESLVADHSCLTNGA